MQCTLEVGSGRWTTSSFGGGPAVGVENRCAPAIRASKRPNSKQTKSTEYSMCGWGAVLPQGTKHMEKPLLLVSVMVVFFKVL